MRPAASVTGRRCEHNTRLSSSNRATTTIDGVSPAGRPHNPTGRAPYETRDTNSGRVSPKGVTRHNHQITPNDQESKGDRFIWQKETNPNSKGDTAKGTDLFGKPNKSVPFANLSPLRIFGSLNKSVPFSAISQRQTSSNTGQGCIRTRLTDRLLGLIGYRPVRNELVVDSR
jgi:hypothetical protein